MEGPTRHVLNLVGSCDGTRLVRAWAGEVGLLPCIFGIFRLSIFFLCCLVRFPFRTLRLGLVFDFVPAFFVLIYISYLPLNKNVVYCLKLIIFSLNFAKHDNFNQLAYHLSAVS